MLRTEGLTKRFGGLTAVDDLSITVPEGEIVGLIGPNGAGKSVLFDLITGFHAPNDGRILLQGTDVTGMPTWERARLGMARGFQQLRIFPEETVRDNLRMAAAPKEMSAAIGGLLGRDRADAAARTDEILDVIDLAAMAETDASELSYGQQKLVQFGMLLMLDRPLILLDEIMAGVNPNLADRLKAQILAWNERGITFFVIEHDIPSITELCDTVIVLDKGSRIATGTPAEIRDNDTVIEAYFG